MESLRLVLGEALGAFGRVESRELPSALALVRGWVAELERAYRSRLLSQALPCLTAALGQAEIQSSSWLASPGAAEEPGADILTNVLYETLRETEPSPPPLPAEPQFPSRRAHNLG